MMLFRRGFGDNEPGSLKLFMAFYLTILLLSWIYGTSLGLIFGWISSLSIEPRLKLSCSASKPIGLRSKLEKFSARGGTSKNLPSYN